MNRTLFAVTAHVAVVVSASTFGCSSSEPATEMQSLSSDECTAQGGTVMPWDTCGNGRAQFGVVEGDLGGACCETLPLLTLGECTEQGGTVHADPGDGSSYRDGCPGFEKMIGTLKLGIEGGVCCK